MPVVNCTSVLHQYDQQIHKNCLLESHLVLRRHRSCHIMRIQCTAGHSMHKLYHIPMTDSIHWLWYHQVIASWPLHNPPIVDILEGIAGYLLLVWTSSLVRISYWVHMGMGMQPTRASMWVTQSYLWTMCNLKRLTSCYGCKATLENRKYEVHSSILTQSENNWSFVGQCKVKTVIKANCKFSSS